MTEELSDRQQILARFEEVRGESVAQRAGCDPLLEARGKGCLSANAPERDVRNGALGIGVREEEGTGLADVPVRTEGLEKFGRERDVAVLLALAGLDVDLRFLDDGFSGASLLRPGLERLRDQVAAGAVDRVYVHSPDRLARKYACQVLLVEAPMSQGGGVEYSCKKRKFLREARAAWAGPYEKS